MDPRTPEVLETAKPDGTHAKVVGRYRTCRIKPDGTGYVRVTQNASKHGRRYHWHKTYDEAVAAAFKWANRKERPSGPGTPRGTPDPLHILRRG
jgi:hypothetical protein